MTNGIGGDWYTQIEHLREDFDLEVKKALGASGRGELPRDFWPTYSAMANTNGGVVLLGVEEFEPGKHRLSNIQDEDKVIKALMDGLNNRQAVSVNLLNNEDVLIQKAGEQSYIEIHIPRAGRKQRPVFIGSNPLTGTYRRNFEGDYHCDEDTVRRMLAEQVEDTRDGGLLEGFEMGELDAETLKVYRTHFRNRKPEHPWNDQDDQAFLQLLGGWTKDRQSGKEGLTLAGLLMFGRLRSILDATPHYVVDYQERPEAKAEQRWIDRITTDGMWSGNLYDFFRMVIVRLYRDLKVPFQLEGAERRDDTPVHEALREALTNTLIHADYSGRVSILVVKRPDLFGFRNPGGLRVPLREAVEGGTSDCRNRNLQKMFQLVGFGEQAGSGLPKVYRNWLQQHWRRPVLLERVEPEQTRLTLRMVSLLPDDILASLDRRFGPKFRKLPEVERLAVATAAIEERVTNERLQEITSVHSHDLTKMLSHLVRDGFLDADGTGRGMWYSLPGEAPRDFLSEGSSHPMEGDSVHKGADSVHKEASSVHNEPSEARLAELKSMASKITGKRRVKPDLMRDTIIKLCENDWLSGKELAGLLERSFETMRIHYLKPMVTAGFLKLLYPDKPNHPRQRYRKARSGLMKFFKGQ